MVGKYSHLMEPTGREKEKELGERGQEQDVVP